MIPDENLAHLRGLLKARDEAAVTHERAIDADRAHASRERYDAKVAAGRTLRSARETVERAAAEALPGLLDEVERLTRDRADAMTVLEASRGGRDTLLAMVRRLTTERDAARAQARTERRARQAAESRGYRLARAMQDEVRRLEGVAWYAKQARDQLQGDVSRATCRRIVAERGAEALVEDRDAWCAEAFAQAARADAAEALWRAVLDTAAGIEAELARVRKERAA